MATSVGESSGGDRLGDFGRLLSEAEVISILSLDQRRNPKGALRWLIRTGRLAVVRLAKGINGFRREDVAAFIESCRVPATDRR
ncbi:MAG: hypothetical protein BIFFINMI_02504 [Phycisphaerae bacterium]|nr:hypothetical protein [Phycisphaerae bacterium]